MTNHCPVKFDNSCKSCLIIPAMSAIFSAAQNSELSSANSFVKLRSFVAISLTYTKIAEALEQILGAFQQS